MSSHEGSRLNRLAPWVPLRVLVTASTLCLFAVTARDACAQVASVAGNVADEKGNAIPRARVELENHPTAATTDSAGSFRINDVTLGRHKLTVRQIGYQFADTVIDVTAAGAPVHVILRRNIAALSPVLVLGNRQGLFGAVGADKTFLPLPNARVRVIGVSSTIMTDSLGQFAIAIARPGPYVLRFEHAGFASRSLSVDVNRNQAKELLITLKPSTENDVRVQREWQQFDLRTRMKGLNAVMVPGEELAATGSRRLSEALLHSGSFSIKNLRLGQNACVFVDGEPRPGWSADAFSVDDVIAVEVYGRRGDLTNTLGSRWPSGIPCGGGAASPIVRLSETERKLQVEMIGIWLKH